MQDIIRITKINDTHLSAIRAIRSFSGLSLRESKAVMDQVVGTFQAKCPANVTVKLGTLEAACTALDAAGVIYEVLTPPQTAVSLPASPTSGGLLESLVVDFVLDVLAYSDPENAQMIKTLPSYTALLERVR